MSYLSLMNKGFNYQARAKNNKIARATEREIHKQFSNAVSNGEKWAVKMGMEMLVPKAKPETVVGTLDSYALIARIEEAELMREELEQIKSMMKERGIVI